MESIGPAYVAAVIAAFRALVRLEFHDDTDRRHLSDAAVLPLTEMLAVSGPFDLVPVADWMIAGGVGLVDNPFLCAVAAVIMSRLDMNRV